MCEVLSKLTIDIDLQYWKVGDRFIYVKNLIDSETVPLGYKGIVQEITKTAVYCDGWAFEFGEIKKLLRVSYEKMD